MSNVLLDHDPVLFSHRLAAIARMSAQQLVAELRRCYIAHFGQVCRGVHWLSSSLQFLQLIAVCVTGPTLAHIFEVLCSNHKHFSGGMPDLFMWRVLAPKEPVALPAVVPFQQGTVDVIDISFSQDSAEAVAATATVFATATSSFLLPTAPPPDGLTDIKDIQLIPGALYQCKCVEVKGPRDRLSDKQRAWIQLLVDGGMDTDVCYVKESSAVARSKTA